MKENIYLKVTYSPEVQPIIVMGEDDDIHTDMVWERYLRVLYLDL